MIIGIGFRGCAGCCWYGWTAGVNESSFLVKVDKAEAATKDPKKRQGCDVDRVMWKPTMKRLPHRLPNCLKEWMKLTMNLVLRRRIQRPKTVK